MDTFALPDQRGLQVKGRIQVLVRRAKTGIEELMFEQENTIDGELKQALKDTMHSNSDFALDNLQATQVAKADLSASENGKDGIFVMDAGATHAAILALMATAVHGTPDGDDPYFRQWAGVYQNLTAGAQTASIGRIGQDYTFDVADTATEWFGTDYAQTSFSVVTLQINDIITINWKITIG